jgi:DNA polymerase-3 subunit alpha
MTPTFKQLINPHQHSESSLDGASTVESIVQKNAKLGATHVCLTEHGNLNSAIELVTETAKQKVKPILGIELYMVPPYVDDIRQLYWRAHAEGRLKTRAKNADKIADEIERKVRNYYFHLTVHFKTYEAYQHFCRISPAMNARAVVKWGEVKPLATIDELLPVRDKITICSSCMIGPVGRTLMGSNDGVVPPNPELAERYYCMLRELVGPDNFFVEIFPHDVTHTWVTNYETMTGSFVKHECTPNMPDGDLQRYMNVFLLRMATKYRDRVVTSLDAHFSDASDKIIQDAKLGNGQEAWKFYNSYHVMTSEEAFLKLHQSLGIDHKTFEGWIDNSYAFADLFKDFKMPTSKTRWLLSNPPDDFMLQLKHKIDRYGRMRWDDQQMVDRLQREIQVLAFNPQKNLLNYFFIIEDIANFCRENNVLINVRGSAGGSLVLYLIGVSATNPLEYDLKFERFLTEGRIKANTLPDVDMDVSDQEAVFRYLEGKYGDGFCRLSTDTLLHLKSSIKDAERFTFGTVRPETEKLTKALPNTPQKTDDKKFVFGYTDDQGNHTDGIIDTNAALQAYAKDNPELWDLVRKMLGIQRNKSVHACGVVIMDSPVQDVMPIIDVNGTKVTGFSPDSLEYAGGVKYDVLGLNTLRDIQTCIQSIHERTGLKLDYDNLPFDRRVPEELAKGNTIGVFQLDTPTARPLVQGIIKPNKIHSVIQCVEVIAGITSLGRPGTLDAPAGDGRTLAQLYVARCNGEQTRYLHPSLEPILGITMGVQLYQEQTLQIFRDLADMSFEEAEVVRRGIGKKDAELLAQNFGRLKSKCIEKGWPAETVDLLVNQVKASERYSFNKSHAVSYAKVAYSCAWLRENYPLDFWKAILSNADRSEVASKFWRHVNSFTLLPNIHNLSESYSIVGTNLVAPLSLLSGIGPKAYRDLISRGPYQNFEQFVRAHFRKNAESAINRPMVYKMIVAGILDPLFGQGEPLISKMNLFSQLLGEVRDSKPEPIDKRYQNITSLGEYLIKKSLISVHSEDLRPLMLPNRGGSLHDHGIWWWVGERNVAHQVLDGDMLEDHRVRASEQRGIMSSFKVIGYVIEEKAKPYRNKTKQATVMTVDVNGVFYEEILWPSGEESQAPSGFKGRPCLFSYEASQKRVFLEGVLPLVSDEAMENVGSVV